MISFGLITEGITDQEVISNILFGFFKNPDIPINQLQPIRDSTDKSRQGNFGNWYNVIEYCKSDYFRKAFQLCDFIIIQVDSDVCEEFGVAKFDSGREITAELLIERIKTHIINEIGEDFYRKVQSKIIFAVSVHSIECWLLPLFYTNNKKGKTKGCVGTLNEALNKKNAGFFIDPEKKQFDIYQELSGPFKKNKILKGIYKFNPSLNIFYSNLLEKDITLNN